MNDTWPPWSKRDEKGLVRYVQPRLQEWLAPLPQDRRLLLESGGPAAVARALYDSLAAVGIRYAHEAYEEHEVQQIIRRPSQLLRAPKEGTCLDLAIAYAGLCLGADLIPVLVVLEEHALVLVSTTLTRDAWDGFSRAERAWFAGGLLADPARVRALVEERGYLAVECTGVAEGAGASERAGEPGARLDFDAACRAGRAQLQRPLRFALDVAALQSVARSDGGGFVPFPFDSPTASPRASSVAGAPLACEVEIRRFRELYLGTRTHVVPFAGRERELAALDAWRADPSAPPRLLLGARMGRGKSALVTRWVAHLESRGTCATVFVPASLRVGLTRGAEVLQALAERLADATGHARPSLPSGTPETWRAAVDALLAFDDQHTPLVVVLDGVDEAVDLPIAEKGLATVLGPSVRVLVTARLTRERPDPAAWAAALGWPDHGWMGQELDVLGAEGLRALLRSASGSLAVLADDEEVVGELARLTDGGDPLLARLYLDALVASAARGATLDGDALKSLSPGFAGLFAQQVRELDATVGASGAPALALDAEALLDTLACAVAPISLLEIARVVPERLRGAGALDRALDVCDRFLHRLDDGTVVLAHTKLATWRLDLLRGAADPLVDADPVQAIHQRYVQLGEDVAAGLPKLLASQSHLSRYRYALVQFVTHLVAARSPVERAETVLTDPWRRARLRIDGDYAGHAYDLRQLLRFPEPPGVGLLLRVSLQLATIASQAAELPAGLFGALVRTGVWTDVQGVRFALARPEPRARFDALQAIARGAPSDSRARDMALTLAVNMFGELGEPQTWIHSALEIAELDPNVERGAGMRGRVAALVASWPASPQRMGLLARAARAAHDPMAARAWWEAALAVESPDTPVLRAIGDLTWIWPDDLVAPALDVVARGATGAARGLATLRLARRLPDDADRERLIEGAVQEVVASGDRTAVEQMGALGSVLAPAHDVGPALRQAVAHLLDMGGGPVAQDWCRTLLPHVGEVAPSVRAVIWDAVRQFDTPEHPMNFAPRELARGLAGTSSSAPDITERWQALWTDARVRDEPTDRLSLAHDLLRCHAVPELARRQLLADAVGVAETLLPPESPIGWLDSLAEVMPPGGELTLLDALRRVLSSSPPRLRVGRLDGLARVMDAGTAADLLARLRAPDDEAAQARAIGAAAELVTDPDEALALWTSAAHVLEGASPGPERTACLVTLARSAPVHVTSRFVGVARAETDPASRAAALATVAARADLPPDADLWREVIDAVRADPSGHWFGDDPVLQVIDVIPSSRLAELAAAIVPTRAGAVQAYIAIARRMPDEELGALRACIETGLPHLDVDTEVLAARTATHVATDPVAATSLVGRLVAAGINGRRLTAVLQLLPPGEARRVGVDHLLDRLVETRASASASIDWRGLGPLLAPDQRERARTIVSTLTDEWDRAMSAVLLMASSPQPLNETDQQELVSLAPHLHALLHDEHDMRALAQRVPKNWRSALLESIPASQLEFRARLALHLALAAGPDDADGWMLAFEEARRAVEHRVVPPLLESAVAHTPGSLLPSWMVLARALPPSPDRRRVLALAARRAGADRESFGQIAAPALLDLGEAAVAGRLTRKECLGLVAELLTPIARTFGADGARRVAVDVRDTCAWPW